MADQSEPAIPEPDDFYSSSQRKLQKQLETDNLATAVVHAVVRDALLPEMADFVSSRDYFFLSTVDAEGMPTVSYKGGKVGIAHVVNPSKIVFPNFNGNGMYFSTGNIAESGKIGMLFIDMCTPNRVRVQGEAKLSQNEEYMKLFPGAEFIIEVNVTRAFYNCARYIHKHERIEETNKYVPDETGNAPFPAWKRIDMLQEVLHPDDIGRAEESGGTITEVEYGQKLREGTS